MNEIIYIVKRKIEAFFYGIMFLVCRIFPIQRGKVTFSSFEGGGYCCNPKYIAEELHREQVDVMMIWFVKDIKKQFPDYIKPVRDNWFNRAYHMSTANVWVDNSRQKYGTLKRRGQYYIQTWHGQIGFKPIGKLRGDLFSTIGDIVSKYDSKMIDMWISNSNWSTKVFQKAFYGEPIYEVGSPRNDIFWKESTQIRDKVFSKLGVEKNRKMVLYAPTFRGGSQVTVRKVSMNKMHMDYGRLKKALEQKTGDNWTIVVKFHPQLTINMQEEDLLKNDLFTDASLYEDMAELLVASDVFITDYSSAAFDAMVGRKIVFLYADDYEDYINDRGDLLWSEDSMPFVMNTNMDELINDIESFDILAYDCRMKRMFSELGIREDGHASEKVVKKIRSYIDRKVD